jgi:hypothetical protein
MAKDFQSLKRDDNQVPIMTGVNIQTWDATAVPQTSPIPMTTGIKIFAIPENAAEMVVKCTVDFRISEVDDMSTYFQIDALTTQAIGVANADYLYIRMDAEDGTLNFYFVLV